MDDAKLKDLEAAQAGTGEALARATAVMARLRGPGGCPWDREQTLDSIKPYTLEETYEVFDAIERRDWPELKDELGDLLLQVLFYAQMASEAGHFNLKDVAEGLTAKLIRRHPHVFGDENAETPDAVLRNWEQIKIEEKKQKPKGDSLLDEVPRTMPATLEATKLSSKAAKVGFDWPDSAGLFAKMDEELAELIVEVEAKRSENVEAEFGDLLFTAMNLARHLKVDPESALRRSTAKFRARFVTMEREAGGAEILKQLAPEELERLWEQAKTTEKKA